LLKGGIGAAASYELIRFSNVMKNERKGSGPAIMNMQQQIGQSIMYDGPTQYEFVFYEKAVVSIKSTITSLLETVVLSGAIVEPEVLEEAKKLIGVMERSLKLKEEKVNGTQA